MIPAAELAIHQAIFAASLDKTCSIQRNPNPADQYGTMPDSWPVVAGEGALACSLSEPAGTYMLELAARLGSQAAWQISLPIGTDIKAGDRVVIGSDTFTVSQVGEPHSYPLGVRALMAEVR